jgi:hypothetical protein
MRAQWYWARAGEINWDTRICSMQTEHAVTWSEAMHESRDTVPQA